MHHSFIHSFIHLQSTIPKVKCAGINLMLWSCFSAAGTEGLIRVEEKLNAPKYWDSLNENPVQSIQNLRLGRRFTFQQDNDSKHTARVAYTQLCEYLWVVHPQPELEPNQIFLEKPEYVHLPHPTWQSLRGEEVRRRIADNCQMLMCKAWRIIPKKTCGCNWCQRCFNKVLSKGCEYLCTCDFLFFIFNTFAKISNKLLSRCHYGVSFVEFWGK